MRILIILFLAVTTFGVYLFFNEYIKKDNGIPVSVIGVHHLGSDYYIDSFYVDKYYEGNIGEGGGGNGMVCCRMLPRKWHPGLIADVRWEVRHIIRSPIPEVPETAEVVGDYRAQVAVEAYLESGDLYVHFFPGGRARIVVSDFSASGKEHPIKWEDKQAGQKATIGMSVSSLFTTEELAEFNREFDRDRAKYGDWR
ncbi:DUF3304 domain-containing protein [Massilia sp. 9096]|uniref:DUF3304 domain-containing protein n=1 Tax=Massilia sp. 9096 TaxID=1500894 RepID=UPI0009DF54D7|nr:DUF3304 domain-containing protein [Massilia sp. 9096]